MSAPGPEPSSLGTVGERLRALRIARGLTSTALAGPMYSVSHVSQIERGKRRASEDALVYFARRLKVSLRYLQTGVPDEVDAFLRYELQAARRELAQGEAEAAADRVRVVLARAESYAVTWVRPRALPLLGQALARDEGTAGEAVSILRRALAEDLTDPEAAPVIAALGRALGRAGDAARGAEVIEAFLARDFDPPLDPSLLLDLHAALVELYLERGSVVLAERAAAAALDLAQEQEPEARAEAYCRASQVMAERGKWEAALDLADRAERLLGPIADRVRLTALHRTSAALCLETVPPRIQEAEQHLHRAEAALEGQDRPVERSRLHLERARLALLQGQAEAALDHARAAQSLVYEGLELAGAAFLAGRALATMGHAGQASQALEEATARYRSLGAHRERARCLRELAELGLAEGDREGAVEAFRSALGLLDPTGGIPRAGADVARIGEASADPRPSRPVAR